MCVLYFIGDHRGYTLGACTRQVCCAVGSWFQCNFRCALDISPRIILGACTRQVCWAHCRQGSRRLPTLLSATGCCCLHCCLRTTSCSAVQDSFWSTLAEQTNTEADNNNNKNNNKLTFLAAPTPKPALFALRVT